MKIVLTLKETVERYVCAVFQIEDLVTKCTRQFRNTSDLCRWPNCRSKASVGKNYCRKHLHGS